MASLLIILWILFFIPASIIWSGYVLSVLWGWFLVPSLGLPLLSIPAAIGFALIIVYLTHQDDRKVDAIEREEVVKELVRTTILIIFKPASALAFGWVVKQWM